MQKLVEKRTITRIFICTLLFSLYHIADFSIDLPKLTFWISRWHDGLLSGILSSGILGLSSARGAVTVHSNTLKRSPYCCRCNFTIKGNSCTRLGDRRARQLSLTSAKGGYTVHRRAPRFSFATIICLLALAFV